MLKNGRRRAYDAPDSRITRLSRSSSHTPQAFEKVISSSAKSFRSTMSNPFPEKKVFMSSKYPYPA